MDLNLVSSTVVSELIGSSVLLELSGDRFVRIESPFVLVAEGTTVSLAPEDDPGEEFAPVRTLVGQSIVASKAGDEGRLSLTFDGGARLEVPPDADYEAWNIAGPNGYMVVCTPGGELMVWSVKSGAKE